MEDVFTVQENIASCIAKTLELSLESEQVQVMQRSSTRDVQAYDYYLKAWSYFHRFDTRNMLYARQMFSRAIEIDPEFARAWGGLADAAAFLYMYSESREEYRQQADEASRKAVELCFSLAEAHASRGLALMLETSSAPWNWLTGPWPWSPMHRLCNTTWLVCTPSAEISTRRWTASRPRLSRVWPTRDGCSTIRILTPCGIIPVSRRCWIT